MIHTNQIDVFTQLGLTVNQAKIYLALAQLEPSTVAQIAKATNLAREVVYRAIPALQKTGIISKTITYPIKFKAVSAEMAVKILLEKRSIETKEVKAKAADLVKQIKSRSDLESNLDTQMLSIVGKERFAIFAKKQMLTAKETMDTMVVYSRLNVWLEKSNAVLKKLMSKNVRVRLLVVCSEGAVKNKELQAFKKQANFTIKFVPDFHQTVVGVIDNKDCIINTSVGKSSVYWSNDSGIIFLCKTYFEKCWNMNEIAQT
ncbi:MAG: TrmB family transcriptional regulator [Candidatus Bathyarchaeia archaeon]